MWFSSKHKPMTGEEFPFLCRCKVDLPLFGCPDVTLFNCACVTVSVLFQDFLLFFFWWLEPRWIQIGSIRTNTSLNDAFMLQTNVTGKITTTKTTFIRFEYLAVAAKPWMVDALPRSEALRYDWAESLEGAAFKAFDEGNKINKSEPFELVSLRFNETQITNVIRITLGIRSYFLLFYSTTLWSCWTAAASSPRSTAPPWSPTTRWPSTRPGSSSTWTPASGTWRFTTTAATWRPCPTTPSSRVSSTPAAAWPPCWEDVCFFHLFFLKSPKWKMFMWVNLCVLFTNQRIEQSQCNKSNVILLPVQLQSWLPVWLPLTWPIKFKNIMRNIKKTNKKKTFSSLQNLNLPNDNNKMQ